MTLDEAVEAFAVRHHWPLARAEREATRLIDMAVEEALRGAARFDRLPRELEPHARHRFEERLRAGAGDPGVRRTVASSGLVVA